MKKLYSILLFSLSMLTFSMEKKFLAEFIQPGSSENFEDTMYKSPQELISNYIQYPVFIDKELKKYPKSELLQLRYGPYNNLLHCVIAALTHQKDSLEDFEQLIENYKPILTWLTEIGLDINEVNDEHATPLILAYRAQIIVDFKEQGNKTQSLIDFLENDLHGHPTYTSLAPQLRFCKKILWEFFTCKFCKHKYS